MQNETIGKSDSKLSAENEHLQEYVDLMNRIANDPATLVSPDCIQLKDFCEILKPDTLTGSDIDILLTSMDNLVSYTSFLFSADAAKLSRDKIHLYASFYRVSTDLRDIRFTRMQSKLSSTHSSATGAVSDDTSRKVNEIL